MPNENEQPQHPKIINAGVDTLLVNFKFVGDDDKPNGDHMPEHVAMQLDEWQARARKEHDVLATDLLFSYRVGEEETQQTLLMRPHGSGIWSWLLYSDDVRLSLSYGTMNGGVFCQARFSAHLLWSIGPQAALIALESTLYDLIGAMVYSQASEIHLCCDVQGWDVSGIDWQNVFVSRVVRIRERPEVPTEEEQEGGLSPNEVRKLEEVIQEQVQEGPAYPFPTTVHRRIATLDFGSHGSDISCQIYNKSAEIKKHRKEWFLPIWQANGYDPEQTVWRVEFRFKRKFLASFDLNEVFSVLGRMDQLWTYATTEWLRYVDLSSSHDSNKSRLATHPAWRVIQAAYSVQCETDTRAREGEQQVRLTHLLDKKPLQVLEQAVCLSAQAEQAVTPSVPAEQVEHHIVEQVFAVRETFRDQPQEVIQQMAQEVVSSLLPEQVGHVVACLSPEPFQEVQAGLIKRTRTMAKRKACIAGGMGYMRSAVALAGDEIAGSRPGASAQEKQGALPDLLASLVWFFGQGRKYDDSRNRSHKEEVLKKRVAYGFITAQRLEEERAVHGVDLLEADWNALLYHLDQLQQKPKDVWLHPENGSSVA